MLPEHRILRARAAAYKGWANTADRTARTAPGRDKFMERFDREVDPLGLLDPKERAKRAEFARRSYFASLALKSARARRKAAS